MTNEERIAEIEKEEQRLYDLLQELDDNTELESTFQEYEKNREPYNKKLRKLDRERRMLMTPAFSKLPKYGSVMSLESFVKNVNSGNFMDYDGSGCYVKDNELSNIPIYPSDVKANSIRKDFDTIIWFNR
jgi:hypothetical protein